MPDTMLAVVKPEAAPGAEVREVKIPSYGRTDVLVKVKVASICGTDLHIYQWDKWAQGRIHPPLIPGHEPAPAADVISAFKTLARTALPAPDEGDPHD